MCVWCTYVCVVHVWACGVFMHMWFIYLFVACLKTSGFHMKISGFHMKSGGFHMESGSFHEKWWFLWFSYENQLKSLKTAALTQITHIVLVFHRVKWEG